MKNFKSDSIIELTKAVINVMKEVKGMEKNSKIGTGNSAYDGTKDSDVKEVFNKVLAENGLAIMPIDVKESTQIDRWEEEQIWHGQSQGVKTKQSVFTKVTTKYLLSHISGEWVVLVGYGHGTDPQDKSAGKSTTYAMKNMLLYTFLTPVGKMDDTDLTHSEDIATPKNTKVNQPSKPKQPQQSIPELVKDSKEWDSIVSLIMEKKLVYLSKLENISISDDLKAELENMIEDVKLELLIDSDEWKSLIRYSNEGKLTKIEQVTKKFRMTDEVLAKITKVINEVKAPKEVKKEEATSNTVKADPKDIKRLPALTDEDYEEAKKKSKIEILKILAEHRMTASRRKELTDLANSK